MTIQTIDDHVCRTCGRQAADRQVLSRHHTSDGVLTWTRCPCGALQAHLRFYGHDADQVVAGSPRPGM